MATSKRNRFSRTNDSDYDDHAEMSDAQEAPKPAKNKTPATQPRSSLASFRAAPLATPSSPSAPSSLFAKPSSSSRPQPPFPSTSTATASASKGKGKEEERYPWLANPCDAQRRPVTDPDYDPRTLYIPPAAYNKLTDFEKQFWDIKKNHFDTVVFFKKGKFFE